MKNIRWGIIGLGRFGMLHAEAVRDMYGCELAAVCNRNAQKLNDFAKRFPEAAACTDYRELLKSDAVDVVTIATHWQEHLEPAKEALLAGKHVFLEKPMAASAAQCRELLQAAEQSSGKLMVGHICRFDPRAGLARDAVRQGKIGRVVSMHAKRNLPVAPGHIRLNKISPLMGDGIHDADLMMWLTGRVPTRVYARNVRVHDFDYPDLGWAMLDFEDSAVGVIETNWCLPPNVPTVIDAALEVVGTEGKLTIDCSVTGFAVINADGNKMSDTVYWPELHGRRVGALISELSYFADCIRSNSAPTVITPKEAAQAVIVMEAAEQSAACGRPVDIPAL